VPKDNVIMLARAGLWLGYALLTGCSFLIDVGRDQCSTDGDCDRAGVGGSCNQGICVAMSSSSSTCDGGECSSAMGGSDADVGDASNEPSGLLCNGVRCEEAEVCFADTCAIATSVAPYMCEADEPPAPVGLLRFTMPVRDFVSDQPLPDLVVLACRENDVACDSPIARFDDPDGTGDVVLELPFKFRGYLEVSSSASLTSLWFFTRPMLEPLDAKVLKAVASTTVELLAAIAGVMIDRSQGIVIVEPFDCDGYPAGGIHFEESKRTATPFYIIDERPSIEATITVRDEVENQAGGGFVNAAPGFTLFTARIGVDGPVLGEVNANVKANTVTYIDIHP
jgi:hypothetical protein